MAQEKILGKQLNLNDVSAELVPFLPPTDLIADTSPQLGADLDVNGFLIRDSASNSTAALSTDLRLSSTGELSIDTTGPNNLLIRNAQGTTVISAGLTKTIAKGGSIQLTALEGVEITVGSSGGSPGAIDGGFVIENEHLTAPARIVLVSGTTAFRTTVSAGNSLPANTTFQLPSDDGTNGYVLSTNGSGVTSWIAGGGGGGNWIEGNNGANFGIAPTSGGAGNNNIAAGYNAQATAGGGGVGAAAFGSSAYANHYAATSIGGYTKSGAAYQTNVGYGVLGDTTTHRSTFGYGGSSAIGTPSVNQSIVTIYDNGKVEPIGDNAMFVAPTYTIASVPAVVEGGMIYVSDATGSSLTGSQCFGNIPAGSPAQAVWVDVTTGIAVV